MPRGSRGYSHGGRGYGGYGYGYGAGAALAGTALVAGLAGAALASPYGYGYGYPAYPYPAYAPYAPVYPAYAPYPAYGYPSYGAYGYHNPTIVYEGEKYPIGMRDRERQPAFKDLHERNVSGDQYDSIYTFFNIFNNDPAAADIVYDDTYKEYYFTSNGLEHTLNPLTLLYLTYPL